MSEFDECVNDLHKDLCSYKPQPLELREYLRANMSVREIKERETLFKKNQSVQEAIYVGGGFVATLGNSHAGEHQVLGLAKAKSILAGFSFTSQQPSEYELVAMPGSFLLGISFAHMKIIYERFPTTEELARLIMADVNRLELERLRLLTRDAKSVVYDFYRDYPDFLPPGVLMSDAEIASYLLISEGSLRSARAKLKNEKKLFW